VVVAKYRLVLVLVLVLPSIDRLIDRILRGQEAVGNCFGIAA
jgi:hypothetical protein